LVLSLVGTSEFCILQSLRVYLLAKGWTVQGSNPGGGGRFFAPVQTGSAAHPTSYTMGTGSLPGVRRPGRGFDNPPQSSAEVKERVEPDLYSPSGNSWPVLGWTLFLPLTLPKRPDRSRNHS
jgi:hypothetical protein